MAAQKRGPGRRGPYSHSSWRCRLGARGGLPPAPGRGAAGASPARDDDDNRRRTTAPWPYKLQPYRLHMRGSSFMPE